jgi:hypothetical protein
MFVYNAGSCGRATLFVSPGTHHPENSNWVDPKTRAPLQFTIRFENGRADVDEEMGRYLIDQELAQRSPIILPRIKTPEELHRPVYSTPIAVGRSLDHSISS